MSQLQNKPTFEQFKALLQRHQVEPTPLGTADGDEERNTLSQFTALIEEVKQLYGAALSQALMDDFMPEGDAVEPGYEDSCQWYTFLPTSWNDVRVDYYDYFQDCVWCGGTGRVQETGTVCHTCDGSGKVK